MHITHIGNTPRIAVLAAETAKNGHRVTVIHSGVWRHDAGSIMRGIQLLRIPSFDPTMPGGYLFSFLATVAALIARTNSIHVHDVKTALFVRLLRHFFTNTSKILTISELPQSPRSARRIAASFDRVFASTRTVQYQLLTLCGIKTEYIPDGYTAPALPDVRPAAYGLRKEGYAVILSSDPAEIRTIIRVCKSAKAPKTLVVFAESPTARGCTRIDIPAASRSALSLIRQAKLVIAAQDASPSLLLHAMDANRQIIATTDPIHEETLGTAAQYFHPDDKGQLSDAIKAVKTRSLKPSTASLRAKNHFSWGKIAQEYLRAYMHSKTVLVPLDSIIPRKNLYRPV